MFTPAFTKLQRCLITSSIWLQDESTRLVWITLLALCDKDGIARVAPGMLSYTARVSEEDTARAVAILEAPDPGSRNSDFEGRRISRCQGGYQVLNYTRYLSEGVREERRQYFRTKKAESRARQRASGGTIRPEHRDDAQ